MAVPEMVPGDVVRALVRRLEAVERFMKEAASTGRTIESTTVGAGGVVVRDSGLLTFLNADGETTMVAGRGYLEMVDPETNGAMTLRRGRIYLWDNIEANPDNPGLIATDQGTGVNMLRMFPPYNDGTGLENSINVQGRRDGAPGNVWVYTDGDALIKADAFLQLESELTQIITPVLGLYGLPTTSSAANLFLGTVGGQWTVARGTSSRRYKQDIEDVHFDPESVLAWRPRTWRDKADVAAVGDDAVEHVGFIAEEVAESTPQFVNFDDEGRPDSLRYDRMVAGLVSVVQEQAAQIAALTARVEQLEGPA